jgi:tetratricopeptide (TPR) repeat protein
MSAATLQPASPPRQHARPARLLDVAAEYQRALQCDPHNPAALAGMSVVALAGRQPEPAVVMAQAAVAAAPRMVTAWIVLGQALKACARLDDAERAYEQAIRLDGMSSLAHLGLGELKLAQEDAQSAHHEFEFALRRQPTLLPALLGLGNALALMGRDGEALEQYQRALALRPRLPEAEFAAGFVHARLGHAAEAERHYRRALVERPDFAAAWMNLGSLLREQGRDVYAEAALRRAVELRPDSIAGWLNLAFLMRELRRPAEAEAHLRTAFALNPSHVETQIAWCQFRSGERELPGAWRWLQWALARAPDQPEANNMLGILLHAEGRFREAVVAFERAEALGHRAASSNRGNTLLDMGRVDDALHAHELAVEREPQHSGAQYNLALTRLRLGDWQRGWPAYEARWHFREVHRRPRSFRQPRWRGEPLEGSRILLHAEQGLGDTIQFCRFATLVVARGGFPILQVQGPVERLLRTMAIVRAGNAEVSRLGNRLSDPMDDFDLECPLLSLPAVFETEVDSVPWPGPYLAAEPEPELAQAKVSAIPNTRNESLRVGLAWAGNPRYKADRQRSMALDTLRPLLRLPGIQWISLQKGPAAEQISALPGDVELFDGASRDRDLADAAALIDTLDLVISTDTSIAHLAGAMAKPVWILLPHLADWRWMQEVETTPWYPTARLLRQASAGDWSGPINRAISDLTQFKSIQ